MISSFSFPTLFFIVDKRILSNNVHASWQQLSRRSEVEVSCNSRRIHQSMTQRQWHHLARSFCLRRQHVVSRHFRDTSYFQQDCDFHILAVLDRRQSRCWRDSQCNDDATQCCPIEAAGATFIRFERTWNYNRRHYRSMESSIRNRGHTGAGRVDRAHSSTRCRNQEGIDHYSFIRERTLTTFAVWSLLPIKSICVRGISVYYWRAVFQRFDSTIG